MGNGLWDDAEVISAYTRAQAIEDGELVAVEANLAREAGFVWPVALTRAVWADCVEWTDADAKRKGGRSYQDVTGRLWDVLHMARYAIKRSREGGTRLLFGLRRVPREGRGHRPRDVTLKLMSGPGDNAEPVITIMQPEED